MPSIIEGFEYDIFISYRHKDNLPSQGFGRQASNDGWVSDFVANLKRELEATFKEEVSVYFDENPHDGLLETHNVGKSLEGKLNCLIFIPIISQTYCDLKSFAWQHEFCVFNKIAKKDQFGRDIKLMNGNVSSRILPVKIHDIDLEDKTLLENELGGVLRAIEFIYKEAGVNRPLKSTDSKNDNQNRTDYRNQVNKVANAIKEIISSLKNPSLTHVPKSGNKQPVTNKQVFFNQNKILFTSLFLVILLAAGYFLYPKLVSNPETEILDKSIAVLPFKNLGNEVKNQYFADGIMDEIINHLAKIKAIRVVSRTSVEQYRSNRKPAIQISEELNVNYILDGSAQLAANLIKICVQLIDAKDDRQIWSETFERTNEDIFSIQAEVAEKIARELKAQITPQEKNLINEIPTSNTKAYDYYLRGKEYNVRFLHSNDIKDFVNSVTLRQQAIALDSNFANAYANIGLSYSWRELNYVNPIKVDFLALGLRKFGDSVYYYANKALSHNPNLGEASNLLGWYYGMNGQFDQAELNFQKAMELSQLHDNKGLGLMYMVKGEFQETYKNWTTTYLKGNNLLPIDYTDAGLLYMHVGNLDRAEYYQKEALRVQPDFKWGYRNMIYLLAIQGRCDEAYSYAMRLLAFTDAFEDYLNMAHLLGLMKKYDDAEKYLEEGLARMSTEYGDNELEGAYIFWMNNRKEEARKRFAKRMEFCERAIREKTPYAYKRAAYDLASMSSFLGNEKEAYRWLNEYAALGFREGLENYIKIDPLFEPLRNQPEFKNIVDKARANKADLLERFKQLEKEVVLID